MTAEKLKKRTKAFALRIIKLVDAMPRSLAGQVIGRQLLRSATSVGANYRAACRAQSRAEFVAKLSIVVEEADESLLYWLELLGESRLMMPALVRARHRGQGARRNGHRFAQNGERTANHCR